MISTITRPDGRRQVTFDGHPLYRYSADAGAGATNGDGVKDKFGTWHLATAPTGAGDAATPGGPSSGGKGASSAAPAGGSSTPQGGTSG